MLESKLELEDKIRVEDKLRTSAIEGFRKLSPQNCSIYFQWGDPIESELSRTWIKGPIDVYSIVAQPEEIQKQFIDLLNAFCQEIEQVSKTKEIAKGLVHAPRRTRVEEMRWLENNEELLTKLAGKWIAVEKNQLIAASEDFTEVSRKVKENGINVPFIIFIPELTEDSLLGL